MVTPLLALGSVGFTEVTTSYLMPCGKQGLLSSSGAQLLTAAVSLVAEHGR